MKFNISKLKGRTLNMCSKQIFSTQERDVWKVQLNNLWESQRQTDLKHLIQKKRKGKKKSKEVRNQEYKKYIAHKWLLHPHH